MMNEKKFNKPLIAIILTAILIGSTFVGVAFAFIPGQSWVTNFADYGVFEGVAANDYYDSRQYSYQINQWAAGTVPGYNAAVNFTNGDVATTGKGPNLNWFNARKSLRIGMTEFGEFATPANAGIAYGGSTLTFAQTESWASSYGIAQQYWIQGWVWSMDYLRAGGARCSIEAYALYSDWITAEGGRKVYSWDGNLDAVQSFTSMSGVIYAGSLSVDGVKVLYDSARLVVARTNVLIHDGQHNDDVAKITFTLVFNKDTKYGIVYKDIKVLLDTKVLEYIYDFAFSERYEIDLARGVNPGNAAYIHWYHNYNTTYYMHPLTGEKSYDVVQAYDPAKQYIYFAGYWPNCTQYSVYDQLVPDFTLPGYFHRVLGDGVQTADIPTPPSEPSTPWVIAQWRYNSTFFPNMLTFLAKSANREIRFVEVFGMTDYNNGGTGYTAYRARDAQDPAYQNNNVDIEVRWLLDGVFNPEDLSDVNYAPFQYISIGQSSAATDSAASGALSDLTQGILENPLPIFDRNDTLFTWTGFWAKGTIPYGLHLFASSATPSTDPTAERARYFETFSNTGKNTGADTTSYIRTALADFTFQFYDGSFPIAQPIAGGWSGGNGTTGLYWYPSKCPLTERWNQAGTTMVGYKGITSHVNGIVNVGGEKANSLTRYFNDFDFAITREGTTPFALINNYNTAGVTNSAPTSDVSKATLDFYPISTWASSQTLGYQNDPANAYGYATIAIARDWNGTRGLQVYGWDARDTYWGSLWASQYLGYYVNTGWIPDGAVAIVIKINYFSVNTEPFSMSASAFVIQKVLGTITEFGTNAFATGYGYDTRAGTISGLTWNGVILVPSLATPPQSYKVWWYEKLPTTTVAKVDFDP